MDTHSVMTPEELAALDPAVRGQRAARATVVRLDGGDGSRGPATVRMTCEPEVAGRLASWLRRCAARNGWPGRVTATGPAGAR